MHRKGLRVRGSRLVDVESGQELHDVVSGRKQPPEGTSVGDIAARSRTAPSDEQPPVIVIVRQD